MVCVGVWEAEKKKRKQRERESPADKPGHLLPQSHLRKKSQFQPGFPKSPIFRWKRFEAFGAQHRSRFSVVPRCNCSMNGVESARVAPATGDGARGTGGRGGSRGGLDTPAMVKKRCGCAGCTTRSYGKAGSKAEYCSGHAEDGMVNVVSKRCSYHGCTKQRGTARLAARRSNAVTMPRTEWWT